MEFKQMEMDDNKRRRNMILYVLIAFVVYLVLSTVLFPNIVTRSRLRRPITRRL